MSTISYDTFTLFISIVAALSALVLVPVGLIPPNVIHIIGAQARSLSQKRTLLLMLIPATSFIVNTTIALTKGIPQAQIQDEHSYLLAADTFAHGRVTNPTPAFWEHFETPHELMRPTYMSKYPPGQGLSLALGQVLTGLPIVGVWLTTAAACGMIYWMLLGFLPATWAMLGGLLAVLHPQLIQWSGNYWGGSVAVLGGAMVLGAWVRLMSRPAVPSDLILGVGLAILANSRPYEGLVLAIPLMLSLLPQSGRKGAFRLLIPLIVVLLPTAAAMGYYNFRVTGHPLRMPFAEYSDQYDVYPKFWFLPKRPQPEYRNDSMREIHTVFEQGDYKRLRTPTGFLAIAIYRLWTLISLHARPWPLLLPLFFGLATLKNKTLRWIWLTISLFLAGLWSENFFLPHYAAPSTAALLLVIIVGWQKLSRFTPLGRSVAIAMAVGVFTGSVLALCAPRDRDSQRAGQTTITDKLTTGKHLIFVQYTPGHLMHDEWVYNQADIANARIIWARYLGSQADAPVTQHYAGREIWLLSVGEKDLHLGAYPK
jgi:hypothetical protein